MLTGTATLTIPGQCRLFTWVTGTGPFLAKGDYEVVQLFAILWLPRDGLSASFGEPSGREGVFGETPRGSYVTGVPKTY